MLTLLVIGMLLVAFDVKPVKAETGTIYIRPDGSVDPPTAPIQRDGDIYTFTDNIYDSIVIERNNIRIDGAGYILQGPGALTQPYSYGFSLSNINNVTIEGMTIRDWSRAVSLYYSSDNTISGNYITGNYRGIYGEYSSFNLIVENSILNNGYDGVALWQSSKSCIVRNRITNNTYYGIVFGLSTNINNTILENTIADHEGSGVLLSDFLGGLVYGNNITDNDGEGLHAVRSNENTISGNNLSNNSDGLYLADSSSNSISENNITANNRYGIHLDYSSYNLLKGNRMASNKYNFGIVGELLSHFVNDVDASNTVDGNAIYYWIGQRDLVVPPDAGYVALVNCVGTTVRNLDLINNEQGILLAFSTDSIVTQNKITNNWYGIVLAHSSENRISENEVTNNFGGISLSSSSSNSIFGNLIADNLNFGIWLSGSSGCSISENNVENTFAGVVFIDSSSNSIYHNNFENNIMQVYGYASTNVWDDGYPSGGNYWSDYTGVDSNSDGIGDTPYIIDESNQDRYPLMNPWSPKPTSPDEAVNELLETIQTWNLPEGTENSLTTKLEDTLHLLDIGNENGATHKLMDFISQVGALRGKKLTHEQADYLISEAQRIIDLIKE